MERITTCRPWMPVCVTEPPIYSCKDICKTGFYHVHTEMWPPAHQNHLQKPAYLSSIPDHFVLQLWYIVKLLLDFGYLCHQLVDKDSWKHCILSGTLQGKVDCNSSKGESKQGGHNDLFLISRTTVHLEKDAIDLWNIYLVYITNWRLARAEIETMLGSPPISEYRVSGWKLNLEKFCAPAKA
jgi:hypothetical protein